MAVLVAGIGYIGARLVTDLLAQGEEVVGVDNLFSTDPAAIEALRANRRFHFIRGSFGDRRALAAAFTIRPVTTVYCLAAQSSAHPKAAAPRYTESTNLLAPRVLLDAMRRYGVRSVVFGSSLRVYGSSTGPETSEETPYGLLWDLAHLSKCYVEKLLEMYAALHGVRCVAARLGIVYGLSPVMKRDHRFMTAPNKFCLQLVRGEEMTLYAGSDRRTGFIHVADASVALRALAEWQGFEGYVPVNVATEWTSAASVAALAGAIVRVGEMPDYGQRWNGGVVSAVGARLGATGFQPSQTLPAGLGEVCDYFRRSEADAAESSAGQVAG